MGLTLEQYAAYLDTRDLTWPAPPLVEAPKARPFLMRLPGIRAVTWGVYGTLLAISGGELYLEHPKPFIMDMALDKTIQEFNMWGSMTRKAGKPADQLRESYLNILRELSTLPGSVKHVEVLCERIWERIVKRLMQKDYKFDAGFYGALNEFSGKIAYFFHSSLQGTECYPEAAGALQLLARRNITQGVVADAQTFTVVQLQRALKRQDAALDFNAVLEPGLRVLSCKVGVRKPSEQLYRQALQLFRERGIQPSEILHVGSRLQLDVVPAKRLGLRTALFAGDASSVQATPEQLKNPLSRPDVLLTQLEQIAEVV